MNERKRSPQHARRIGRYVELGNLAALQDQISILAQRDVAMMSVAATVFRWRRTAAESDTRRSLKAILKH